MSPAGAVLFRHGERLGTDEITVQVPRGGRMTLVAQLDGYLPRSVVVDSWTKHVNIVLSRPLPTGGKAGSETKAAAAAAAAYPEPGDQVSELHTALPAAPTADKPAAEKAAPATSARQWEPSDDAPPL